MSITAIYDRLEETELHCPGMKGGMRILQLSDNHAAGAYDEDTQAERDRADKQTEQWHKRELTPIGMLSLVPELAKATDADIVILTGDAMDYVSRFNLDTLRALRKSCPVPLICACGNHDIAEYFDAHELFAELPECLYGGLTEEYCEGIQLCRAKGLALAVVDDSRRVITQKQYAGFCGLCEECAAAGESILVFMHMPIDVPGLHEAILDFWGSDGPSYFCLGGGAPDEATAGFIERVKTDPAVIGLVDGHVHFAYESDLAPDRKQYTAAPGFEGYARLIEIK